MLSIYKHRTSERYIVLPKLSKLGSSLYRFRKRLMVNPEQNRKMRCFVTMTLSDEYYDEKSVANSVRKFFNRMKTYYRKKGIRNVVYAWRLEFGDILQRMHFHFMISLRRNQLPKKRLLEWWDNKCLPKLFHIESLEVDKKGKHRGKHYLKKIQHAVECYIAKYISMPASSSSKLSISDYNYIKRAYHVDDSLINEFVKQTRKDNIALKGKFWRYFSCSHHYSYFYVSQFKFVEDSSMSLTDIRKELSRRYQLKYHNHKMDEYIEAKPTFCMRRQKMFKISAMMRHNFMEYMYRLAISDKTEWSKAQKLRIVATQHSKTLNIGNNSFLSIES